jgi:hypothetical protein
MIEAHCACVQETCVYRDSPTLKTFESEIPCLEWTSEMLDRDTDVRGECLFSTNGLTKTWLREHWQPTSPERYVAREIGRSMIEGAMVAQRVAHKRLKHRRHVRRRRSRNGDEETAED